jgi:hypothetical protein
LPPLDGTSCGKGRADHVSCARRQAMRLGTAHGSALHLPGLALRAAP